MDLDGFKNEFNLVYNNLASNQAAGLTSFEISVYLTKSQDALVDTLYQQFETSERVRRLLSNIVVTVEMGKLNSVSESDMLYPEYTVPFAIPTSMMLKYIVDERVKMSDSAEPCIRDKYISVKPVSHDEVDRLIENPFKFNSRKAFRLDTSKDTPYIEILSKDKHIASYKVRYIKKPTPIIIEDLINDENIDGYQTAMNCILDESLHRQIVEIAAKMAYQDYKAM